MTEDFVLKDNKNPVLENIFNREKALVYFITGS